MSAGVPRHKLLPVSRGWLSENILAARLGENFSLDITFHRTGFTSADAILPKGQGEPTPAQLSVRHHSSVYPNIGIHHEPPAIVFLFDYNMPARRKDFPFDKLD